MAERQLAPTIVAYDAVILSCEQLGDYARAIETLRAIDEAGLEPTVMSFTIAIAACEKAGQPERVAELRGDAQKRGMAFPM